MKIGPQNGGNGFCQYPRKTVLHLTRRVKIVELVRVDQYGSSLELPEEKLNGHGTIPSGVSILIPPLNSECSTAEFPDLTTEEELRECAKSFQDQTTQLDFVLDGKRFEGLENNRIVSPLFNVTFPEDNLFGAPAGITNAVSDGNWVFLKPLSKGEHELAAKGVSLDVTTTATNTFVTDVTYHLKVE